MRNFKIPRPEQLERIIKQYPVGTRVELIEMDDPYTKLSAGVTGTVVGVDSMGDLLMNWDTGSSLKLIIGVDQFKVLKDAN